MTPANLISTLLQPGTTVRMAARRRPRRPVAAPAQVPAARGPRTPTAGDRLLVIEPDQDGQGQFRDGTVGELAGLLGPGDLLVVNDAATLPASLYAQTADGDDVEVRLVGQTEDGDWTVALLGEGSWRQRTEDRPLPPRLSVGETLRFGPDLHAGIERVHPLSPRLIDLRFDRRGAALWAALYRHGRPVQYSHLLEPLALWDVQTVFAGPPWAVEQPSAARPLSWELLSALRRRGVRLAQLTHAAGLSSTGDPAIDAALPLPERYSIPASTVEVIAATRAAGGRVIAVGTSVVRALEGSALRHSGELSAGEGTTDLKLGPGSPLRVVDGILTGMHEPGGSHHGLMQAFVDGALLDRAYRHALSAGYLWHEFGDATLVLRPQG
jgi:S-adenosylmethionine:tRNA ribosyltransferase-isomerase